MVTPNPPAHPPNDCSLLLFGHIVILIMFWTLSKLNTNSAKDRLPCAFSFYHLVWFLSSFHYYCHCYHLHAFNALFLGVGASTRVSWQSQQYFEETIIVRHPPKAIHPEKNHQNKPSFSAWPHREARESWRVCLATV